MRLWLPLPVRKPAEIGSGSATTKGAIAFTLKDSYGQFNRLRHHGGGVIR